MPRDMAKENALNRARVAQKLQKVRTNLDTLLQSEFSVLQGEDYDELTRFAKHLDQVKEKYARLSDSN